MNNYWSDINECCKDMTEDQLRLYLSDKLSICVGQPVIVQIYDSKCRFVCGSKSIDFPQKYLRDRRWDIVIRSAEILEEEVLGTKL